MFSLHSRLPRRGSSIRDVRQGYLTSSPSASMARRADSSAVALLEQVLADDQQTRRLQALTWTIALAVTIPILAIAVLLFVAAATSPVAATAAVGIVGSGITLTVSALRRHLRHRGGHGA